MTMCESTNLRVPKSMDPDHVVWAFRYGVAWARYSVLGDASAISRHGLAYTNHYRNVHALAGRVRVAATRRLRDRVAQQPEGSEPLSDMKAHIDATYEDHISVAPATAWRDRHGDVWKLGSDGMLWTPETAPFPREHVEKKWGPLVPEPDEQEQGR